jgi:four helix bundle protein
VNNAKFKRKNAKRGTEAGMAKPFDIKQRTFEFAVRIVKLCRVLSKDQVNRILATQVLKSGTSVGANIEEAQAAQSRADFVNKSAIALKEARETQYWLRLIAATDEKMAPRMSEIIEESREVRDILGAITSKARRNNKTK